MTISEYEPDRENRITMQIVVDAYHPEEVAMGWYYYLQDTLQFPFPATHTVKRRSSPTPPVKSVAVIGMSDDEDCQSEMCV